MNNNNLKLWFYLVIKKKEEGKNMNNKEMFANTISELGSHAFLGMNACEKYGMTWGCDEDCPVLNEGKCENYSSVEDYISQKNNE